MFLERPGNKGCSRVGSPQRHEEAWGDWFSWCEGPKPLRGEAGQDDRSLSMKDLVYHGRELRQNNRRTFHRQ